MNHSAFDYNEAFSRNLGWFTEVEQQKLRDSTVAIAGLGGVGGIHLLTLATLITLPYGLIMRRRGRISSHKSAMVSLFLGLVIAGAFTLIPGRLMHQVTFGQAVAGR